MTITNVISPNRLLNKTRSRLAETLSFGSESSLAILMNPRLFFTLTLSLGLFATTHGEDSHLLQPVFTKVNVERPISIVVPPDGTGRLFLIQQRGQVRILPKDESSSDAQMFLDYSTRGMEAKNGLFEEGLQGFAFHPKFKENGKFYFCHTQQDLKRSVISEMRVSSTDANKADESTERVLLEVPQPYWNHDSGNMAFGPDGFLYLSFGDGGGMPGGDPLRTAQNRFILNGKILRIDVDRAQGSRAYGIPPSNPFVGQDAVREEVYSYGMRNPWGLHFDTEGTLWCADVGQDVYEEINHIVSGGNYGWSFREGSMKYPGRTDEPPADTKFEEPIFQYDHSHGISITGGVVYRGSAMTKQLGCYIYGDWGHGRVWALRYDKATKKVVSNDTLIEAKLDDKGKGQFKPTAFCEDANHEVLALDWMGGIYRLAVK
jgi:glucose/arabinose dehydrogenase